MYLANDVIQNSKKKGPEYSRAFFKVLTLAFRHIFECCSSDTKTISALQRILSIWEDRGVYETRIVNGFRKELQSPDDVEETNENNSNESTESSGATSKRKIGESERDAAKRARSSGHGEAVVKDRIKTETIEVNGTKETHVILSQHVPIGKWLGGRGGEGGGGKKWMRIIELYFGIRMKLGLGFWLKLGWLTMGCLVMTGLYIENKS